MSLPTLPPSNRPNLNPTPGSRYRELATNISDHRKIVENNSFQRMLDFAMLEYQAVLTREIQSAPNMAGGQGLKMCGVSEFVAILKTLSEQPMIPRQQVTTNLDHSV